MSNLTGGSVSQRIARRIASQGPIPFAAFMDAALYGEGGYYAVDRPLIGRHGDFVTGSRSRLFANATDRLLAKLDQQLGRSADFLEVGFGDGQHLSHLVDQGRSQGLFAHDRVKRPLPGEVSWIDPLQSAAIIGLVFSYELFDALPVHRLIWRSGRLRELWVQVEPPAGKEVDSEPSSDAHFVWLEDELSDPNLEEMVAGMNLENGQIVDLSPGWDPLYRQLAGTLQRGLLLTFDYGYSKAKLTDARIRRHGTLACYREHQVHRDPFVHVGEQDLTAHVDFSLLRQTGEAAGLTTLGRFKLAEWLTAFGLFDDLADADHQTREEAQLLLNPAGMGSEIQVLVQAQGGMAGVIQPLLASASSNY